MHSNKNKKQCGSDHMKGSLAPSPQLLTNTSSKKLCASNAYSTYFDPKLLPASLECTNTQDKDEKMIPLTAKTKLIYDHFISVRKADKTSLEYLEASAKNFSLTISLTEWGNLSKYLLLSESDEKFPQYSYNSKTAIVTIMSKAGPLHENIVEACLEMAMSFKFTTPKHYQSRISLLTSTTFKGFRGAYFGSCKIPDLAIAVKDDKGRIPRIIFEIGVSESYKHLTESAKLWLEGKSGVQEYILIKIHETPRYRSPSVDTIDIPPSDQIVQSDFKSKSEFGPVVYKDLRWTGTISRAFLETWTLDTRTKVARRGERTDLLLGKRTQEISLKLSTLFDISPDQEIQALISAETIREKISEGLIYLGHSRCIDKIEELEKDRRNLTTITSTMSDGVADALPPVSHVVNGPSGTCKRLTKGTIPGTKPLVLGQKRHLSLIRDKAYPGFCLCLAYPGLHIRRTFHQLSHQVIPSGGLSNIHKIDILSSYRTMYRRSAPQLVKGITHQAVPGYIKKINRVCASRNPIRLFGFLSLIASSGCLGGLHALSCQSMTSRTGSLGRYDMANS